MKENVKMLLVIFHSFVTYFSPNDKQIGLKTFCTTKETMNKTRRQPTELQKIFVNGVTDKGLISKIYKQLTKLNTKIQFNQKLDRRSE